MDRVMGKIYNIANIENINCRIQVWVCECSQHNSFNFLFEKFYSKMLEKERIKNKTKIFVGGTKILSREPVKDNLNI